MSTLQAMPDKWAVKIENEDDILIECFILIEQGKKLEAVKIYSDFLGSGLFSLAATKLNQHYFNYSGKYMVSSFNQ
jgi:hypothetical protein